MTVERASPEISFRSTCCSRMNSIVSAASRSEPLLEDHERARDQSRRRLARRVGRQRSRSPRRRRPPGARPPCAPRGRLQLRRELERAGPDEDVGRAHDVARPLPAAVQGHAAPLPRRRRTAPRRRPARASPGSGRRSPGACGCARRPSSRSARARAPTPRPAPPSAGTTATSSSSPSVRVPVLSTQIVSTAASASVAAICWTSVFCRASRTAATARVTLIRRTRPSGISVTSPAVAVCAASWNGVSRALEREQDQDARAGRGRPSSPRSPG